MERRVFNKLIRDNIPQKIAVSGAIAKIRTLEIAEYIAALKNKIVEEAQELAAADDQEIMAEIADVQEVLEALIKNLDLDPAEITNIKSAKAIKNGAFEKRLFLEYTEE